MLYTLCKFLPCYLLIPLCSLSLNSSKATTENSHCSCEAIMCTQLSAYQCHSSVVTKICWGKAGQEHQKLRQVVGKYQIYCMIYLTVLWRLHFVLHYYFPCQYSLLKVRIMGGRGERISMFLLAPFVSPVMLL